MSLTLIEGCLPTGCVQRRYWRMACTLILQPRNNPNPTITLSLIFTAADGGDFNVGACLTAHPKDPAPDPEPKLDDHVN